MLKFLVVRPIAICTISIAFILLGVYASLCIPTSLLPDIAIPEITVQISYPNKNAQDIQASVIRPLKGNLLQLTNIETIESQARDGMATIKLSFGYNSNIDLVFIEVNEKIDQALNNLPNDLPRPIVVKASATDIPILNLSVSLKARYTDQKFLELSDFSKNIIKKRIEQLPEIALADMSGQVHPEIIITPDKNKLQELKYSIEKLTKIIQENNIEFGDMLIQNGVYQYNFKFENPLQTINDIKEIDILIHNKLFKLKDLANVALKTKQSKGWVVDNNGRSIVFAIIKQTDAKVYTLNKTLHHLIASLKTDYPDLEFNTNQDQTDLLKISINNLKSSLLIGGFLAIVIVFFFLKDVLASIAIAICIPLSIVITLFFMYLCGLSLNIISLSGLILGVGMMIDNAIIVIDNIAGKSVQAKITMYQACVNGTNEIISPLISSTLTTCSIFLPLIFLSGITGALFFDQAIAISIGLCASLFVSILFLPVIYHLGGRIQQKWKLNKQETVKQIVFELWYEEGFYFFQKKKWIIYVISALFILTAITLFNVLPYAKLPNLEKNEVVLILDWNENINLKENNERISKLLKNSAEIQEKFILIGQQDFLLQSQNIQSFSEATIYLKSADLESLYKLKKSIQEELKSSYPNAIFSLNNPKTIFEYIFKTENDALFAEVYLKKSGMIPLVKDLDKIVNLIGGATSSLVPLKKTTTIEIIHENLMLFNVSQSDLLNELKTIFNQNTIDALKLSNKNIPIKLNYDLGSLNEIIDEQFIKSENNQSIPLRHLIKLNTKNDYKAIYSNETGEYLKFKVDEKAYLDTLIKTFEDNKDFSLKLSGDQLGNQKIKAELITISVVAVLLLYFIMAAQFESLWQPLIIILELPIDIGGSLLFLWFFGASINIMSFIGIVFMSSIVINDSILKIHTINKLRTSGLSVSESIIKAGKTRLKPILMTSATTILALLPFLFIKGIGADLQKPLALTIIGGMLIGTFISLYLIPILYQFFSSVLSKKG